MLRYVTMIACKNGKIWFLGFSNQQMYVDTSTMTDAPRKHHKSTGHSPFPSLQCLATLHNTYHDSLRKELGPMFKSTCSKANALQFPKRCRFRIQTHYFHAPSSLKFQMLPKSKTTYPLDARSKDIKGISKAMLGILQSSCFVAIVVQQPQGE